MKRLLCLLLASILLFGGCSSRYRTDISREDIMAVYEEAGYEVWSRMYDEKLDYGKIGYVQADHPNGDYIYFTIFETEADAKAYKEEFYHPAMMGLFSVIFGKPSWPHCDVYGCIVVEYDDANHFDPFEALLMVK